MPSKAKRMQISAACYQFSLVSLSPWNYKSVVPTAPFPPAEAAGDHYEQEACRGGILGAGSEMWIRPLRNPSFFSRGVGADWPQGTSGVHRHHHQGLWRLAKTRLRGAGGWLKRDERKRRKWEATLCLPPLPPTPTPHRASKTRRITNKMIKTVWKSLLQE